MSDRRGPLGETAESLLERTRAVFATHQWFATDHLILQWMGSHAWETTTQTVPEGWESVGFLPGTTYRPIRTLTGLEVQYHHRFNSEQKLVFYAQQTWDVGFQKRKSIGPSFQAIWPFTSVIGLNGAWKSWTTRLEYAHQSTAHCRDCWDYLNSGVSGPMRAEIMNGGLSLHGLWRQSLRFEAGGTLHGRWNAFGIVEMNDQANHWLIRLQYKLQDVWPLYLIGSAGKMAITEPLNSITIPEYSLLQLGLAAGILGWK